MNIYKSIGVETTEYLINIIKWIIYVLLITIYLIFLPILVNAQYSVSVIKMNDLTFGNMLAGNTKTILPSGAGAALFQTSLVRTAGANKGGNKNGAQDITVVFNLPNQLNNSGHSLSITFGPNSAMWANGSNTNGAKSFDPTQQQQLKVKKNKDLYIWLGGTVSSSLAQWSGKYSNVITVTVNALNN